MSAIAAEHQAPDLWAAARQERAWLTASPSPTVNSAFTEVEREIISQHMRTIGAHIEKNYALTAAQLDEVNAQLDYLAEASKRLGRFDWRGLTVSTVIAIVLQIGLTPDRAHDLMRFVAQLLGSFVSGAAQLLEP